MKFIRIIIWLFCVFIIDTGLVSAQKIYTVKGQVLDSNSKPISGVNVTVQGADISTFTNAKGYYTIRIEEGYYKLYFAASGFDGKMVEITVQHDIIRNMVLLPVPKELGMVQIKGTKRDRANEVMQHLIDNKERWREQILTSKCDIYIRAVDETNINKKIKKNDIPDSIKLLLVEDSISKGLIDTTKNDSATLKLNKKRKENKEVRPAINFTEILLNRSYKYPNLIKEVKEAQKKIGDIDGLFYLSTTEGNFNFYNGTLYIKGLSDNTFITPVNDYAFLNYKFDLKNIYSVGDTKVYVIKVIPRSYGNALMSGEIHVNESLWNIRKVSLTPTANKLKEYDEFTINQEFDRENDTLFVLHKQEFIYKIKLKKGAVNGRTVCYYSNYILNVNFPKNYFGNELSYTKDDAYEKDSAFWDSARKEPLTANEIRLIHTTDSIHEARNKKEYLDSCDSVYNRVTFLNVVWNGQGHINRAKQQYWNFPSILSLYNPVNLGGHRVNAWVSYYKKFKNRRTISIAPYITYGFRNKDYQGDISLGSLYNPYKRGSFNFSAGRSFDLIFDGAAWVNRFRRSNFYLHNYINFDHDVELINGLYLDMYVEYAQRKSVANYTYGTLSNQILGDTNNLPIQFDPYTAFTSQIKLTFVPFQKYMREPREKIILGSKWPTFYAFWRKGIPNVFKSSVDFDYIELSMRQKINFGIIGNSEYRIRGGSFFNTRSVKTIDYKYQRRGDPLFFTNPISTFQMLGSTFYTFNWFMEGHYMHRFNGFFTNKIPYFKKLNINEVGGSGFLFAPEKDLFYGEFYFGLERVFKIDKYRYRLGIYYAFGFTRNAVNRQWQSVQLAPGIPWLDNTIFGKGLKISLEFYDRRRNQFSF